MFLVVTKSLPSFRRQKLLSKLLFKGACVYTLWEKRQQWFEKKNKTVSSSVPSIYTNET